MSEGEDVIERLKKFCEEEKADYYLIIGGSGRIKDYSMISSSRGARIDTEIGREPIDVTAVSGKIENVKGRFSATVNVSLSRSGFNTISGQLTKAKAGNALEIGLRKIDESKIIMA